MTRTTFCSITSILSSFLIITLKSKLPFSYMKKVSMMIAGAVLLVKGPSKKEKQCVSEKTIIFH